MEQPQGIIPETSLEFEQIERSIAERVSVMVDALLDSPDALTFYQDTSTQPTPVIHGNSFRDEQTFVTTAGDDIWIDRVRLDAALIQDESGTFKRDMIVETFDGQQMSIFVDEAQSTVVKYCANTHETPQLVNGDTDVLDHVLEILSKLENELEINNINDQISVAIKDPKFDQVIDTLIARSKERVPALDESMRAELSKIDSHVVNVRTAAEATEIAGVIAGIKPTSIIFSDWSDIDFDKLGIVKNFIKDNAVIISRQSILSSELSRQFQVSWSHPDLATFTYVNRRIGKLLGYPESATEYFIKRFPTVYEPDELPIVMPRSIQGTTLDELRKLVLSPDSYESEIEEYLKPLEAATKRLLPNTFALYEERAKKAHTKKVLSKLTLGLYKLPTGFDSTFNVIRP